MIHYEVEKLFTIANMNHPLYNIMEKLDYIFPMLVGVLTFGNFLWMITLEYYDFAVVSIVVSGACIILAKMEQERKNTPK
jgi:hypothetical protein